MHLLVYLPLLFSGLFGLAAPVLGCRLPPAPATWLLSAGSLLTAAASTTALLLLGFTLVGQTPLLATRGHWSSVALRHHNPVAAPVAVLALTALTGLALGAGATVLGRWAAVRDAYRLAAELPAHGGELAVIDSPDPAAYAVPGRPGRIVVTTGLLRRLDAGERRAVLTHERSHLTHRHHLHQTVAHLAAAANPLLRPLPAAVALACERWADEDAARTTGRATVADSLTRIATAARSGATSAAVLAAATIEITARVDALRGPAPRVTLWRVGLLLGLLAGTALAVGAAAHDTEQLFELAQYAYSTAHR